MPENELNSEDALRHLEDMDRRYGVNNVDEEISKETPKIEQPKPTLGTARSFMDKESAVSESPWKILSFAGLPSQGLFYPNDSEILLRSARTKEIRHWSTIDEKDPIDVREKINFILKELTKFHIKGKQLLPFSYFLEVDRYHLLFRLYELTFPNQENKLWAKIKCTHTNCGHINRVQVTSQNLIGFSYPEEVMKWYSPEEKCWVVESEKLQKTIKIWMPTISSQAAFRTYREEEERNGIEIDKAFYEFGPYLINGMKRISQDEIYELKMKSIGWSDNEFIFIHKFTKMLKDSSLNKAACVCEKCKQPTESHIFLGGSFTVKDIFIISAGLDALI